MQALFSYQGPGFMIEVVDGGILSWRREPGAYMPTITPLSDGSMIACQHVGAELGSADNHIEVLRSTDGGANWVNEGSIHDGRPPEDGWSYRAPHVSEVPGNRLVMTATRFEMRSGKLFDPNSEVLQRPEMLLFRSDDAGRTWSAPEVVPVDLPPEKYTCNGAGVLLQLAPDRWMYPLETWKPEGCEGPPDQKAAVVFSADMGRTWGEFTVVADDPLGAILWWDQMNAVLPDGRIYTMLWTHRYGTSEDLPNHWTVSEDGGRTWSAPRPTNLLGQVCSPIALADGRVFTGSQAVQAGLVDAIGSEGEARAWLAEVHGVAETLPAVDVAGERDGLMETIGAALEHAVPARTLALDGLIAVWHPDVSD